MTNINAIILDLGGVLLNLDFQKTEDAFVKLGIPHFNDLFNRHHADRLFTDFEIGKVTPKEFTKALKKESGKKISDEQIIAAWNAMLLDFPADRINLLIQLKKNYKLFLLSNTNAIHLPAFNLKLKESYGINSLDKLFDRVYYSHLIRERKPHLAAYKVVMLENDLNPATTLFVDDTLPNVEGAEKTGLLAVQLKQPKTINKLMEEMGLTTNG